MSCLGEPRRHVCVREPSGTIAQRTVCGVAEYSLQSKVVSNIIALCKIKCLYRDEAHLCQRSQLVPIRVIQPCYMVYAKRLGVPSSGVAALLNSPPAPRTVVRQQGCIP